MQNVAYCYRNFHVLHGSSRNITKTLLAPAPGKTRSNGANSTSIILAMKLTILLLTAAFLNVGARGLSQTVSMSGTDIPMQKVFSAIREQTGYLVFSNKELLENAKPLTVDVRQMPLKDFMTMILKDKPLTFEILNKTILISEKTAATAPVMIMVETIPEFTTIRGRVVRMVNKINIEPLAGITITVKGSKNMVLSDDQGMFSINVEGREATLIFSSINYERQEIKLQGGDGVNMVVLQPKVVQMQEVTIGSVNTGYQILDKQRATGSFGKPDMKVFANRSGALDLMSRLDGQVAGLTINPGLNGTLMNTNGSASRSQSALIRGKSSAFISTEPLYVVNGVIVADFNSINLDDVADITVLKDAAAAAIWGARAANGVIVVVTKNGGRDQKLKVNYSGFVNFMGKPDFNYSPTLNSKQYIDVAKSIFDSTVNNNPWSSLGTSFIAPHDLILYNRYRGLITQAQANASLDSLSNISNIDQINDLWYRNSIATNHTISVSGGGSLYNFYGSLNYIGQQTSDPGAKNNTYRVDLSQEFNPGRNIKISLNTSLTDVVRSAKTTIAPGNTFLPYQLFRDASGNNISMPYLKGNSDEVRKDYEERSRVSLDYNPLDEMNYGHSNTNNLSVNVTANAAVKLWKGLSFLGTYGYLTSPGTTTSYNDIKSFDLRKELVSLTYAPTVNSTPEYLLPTTGGTYRVADYNQRNWTVRNQLAYTYTGRNGNDVLNLQAGQDASESLTTSGSTEQRGYDEDLQTYTIIDISKFGSGFVSGTVPGYGFFSYQPFNFTPDIRSRYTSYFGLASYTLNQKYSIDGSWRTDHSSLFGNDVSAQNKPIYSFGAKWNIARENFMKKAELINDLQIRATYGITGNSPSGSATTKPVLYPEQSYSGPLVGGPAYRLESVANTKLTWESTHTQNIGIDFSILNRRLSGSIEYYHKKTTGLLANAPLDDFTGQGSAVANLGTVLNKGIEMTLRSVNLRTKNFSWSSSFVISHNSNKLLKFTPPSSYSLTASSRIYGGFLEGYAMQNLWAYRFAGLDKVGDPQIYLTDKTITKTPNTAKLEDVAYMGTTTPTVNGGFGNTFTYKGFDLAINMIYNFGAVMRRDVNSFYSGRLASSSGLYQNIPTSFLDRWQKPGDESITNTPAYRADGFYNYFNRDLNYYKYGDVNVVSASYVKVRDVTLSYNLNTKVAGWLGVQGASVRLQVNNFMVWKNNKYNIDPEYQDFTNGIRSTRVNQHAVTVGANINF